MAFVWGGENNDNSGYLSFEMSEQLLFRRLTTNLAEDLSPVVVAGRQRSRSFDGTE